MTDLVIYRFSIYCVTVLYILCIHTNMEKRERENGKTYIFLFRFFISPVSSFAPKYPHYRLQTHKIFNFVHVGFVECEFLISRQPEINGNRPTLETLCFIFSSFIYVHRFWCTICSNSRYTSYSRYSVKAHLKVLSSCVPN